MGDLCGDLMVLHVQVEAPQQGLTPAAADVACASRAEPKLRCQTGGLAATVGTRGTVQSKITSRMDLRLSGGRSR